MRKAIIINKDKKYGQMVIDNASKFGIPEGVVKHMEQENNNRGMLYIVLNENEKYTHQWCSANINEDRNKEHIESITSKKIQIVNAQDYFFGLPEELFTL